MSAENVKVSIRFCPNTRSGANAAKFADECQVSIHSSVMKKKNQQKRSYRFDRCWQGDCSQEDVYALMGRPLLNNIFEGYNSTLFVYGQTGSGKTYTMFGPDGGQMNNAKEGVVPRLMRDMFHVIKAQQENKPDTKYTVTVSIVDVYLEKVRDLQNREVLNPTSSATNLKVRWDKKIGVYLTYPDDRQHLATELEVNAAEEVMRLIEEAIKIRTKTGGQAKTKMNAFSSRSHFVIQVKLKEESPAGIKTSKLLLCDLAGSEKVRNTGATGVQLEQAKNINYGLSVLGNVLNSLTDKKRMKRGWGSIPFRDSKLTSILQDSLGGNCKTALVCACRPDDEYYAETLSTLRFGSNAKKIQNKVRKNETLSIAQYKARMKLYERRLQNFEETLHIAERKYDASSKWAHAIEEELEAKGVDIAELAEKAGLLTSDQIERQISQEAPDEAGRAPNADQGTVGQLLQLPGPGSRRHSMLPGLPSLSALRRPDSPAGSYRGTPRVSAEVVMKLQDAREEIEDLRRMVSSRDERINYLEGQLDDYHELEDEWAAKAKELGDLKGKAYNYQRRCEELEKKVKFLERDNSNLEKASGKDCMDLFKMVRASSLATAMSQSQKTLLRVQDAVKEGRSEEIVQIATDFAEQASEITRLKRALAASQAQNKALHELRKQGHERTKQRDSFVLDLCHKYQLEKSNRENDQSSLKYKVAQLEAQVQVLKESRDDAMTKLKFACGDSSDIRRAAKRRANIFSLVRASTFQNMLSKKNLPRKKRRRRPAGAAAPAPGPHGAVNRPRSQSDGPSAKPTANRRRAPPAIRSKKLAPAQAKGVEGGVMSPVA